MSTGPHESPFKLYTAVLFNKKLSWLHVVVIADRTV